MFFKSKGWIKEKPPDNGMPTDWHLIDKSLAEAYGYTPDQIEAMTLPEKFVLCQPTTLSKEQEDERTHEIIQNAYYWNKLTAEEKLEYARFERNYMT